jgi:erythromycin esterase
MSVTTMTTPLLRPAFAAGTLDPSAPLDDLRPLADLVGDARVVAIGESAHYVREFNLVRHRFLQFLVERLGFEVYALEASALDGKAVDRWVAGGEGSPEALADRALALGLGRVPELVDTLTWMRDHNQRSPRPVRFRGTDLVGSGGSAVPALAAVADYLRENDPDALPLAERATELARTHHAEATFAVLARYAGVARPDADELSALLGRLLERMETMRGVARRAGREVAHAETEHVLRAAWRADHLHRDFAGRGLPVAPTARDAYMAESVLRILEEDPPRRIVFAAHNVHIQKAALRGPTPAGMLPAGHFLADALGHGYVALAATAGGGRTAQIEMDGEQPEGFRIVQLDAPEPADGSLESLLSSDAPLTVTDLRPLGGTQQARVIDRMAMEGYHVELPVVEAFDAVAHVPTGSISLPRGEARA